jgi:hypothetical protein
MSKIFYQLWCVFVNGKLTYQINKYYQDQSVLLFNSIIEMLLNIHKCSEWWKEGKLVMLLKSVSMKKIEVIMKIGDQLH